MKWRLKKFVELESLCRYLFDSDRICLIWELVIFLLFKSEVMLAMHDFCRYMGWKSSEVWMTFRLERSCDWNRWLQVQWVWIEVTRAMYDFCTYIGWKLSPMWIISNSKEVVIEIDDFTCNKTKTQLLRHAKYNLSTLQNSSIMHGSWTMIRVFV